MKLYYLMGRYCRTQDEARAHAKETGVRFNPEEDVVHVPTDARGLVDYLNRVLAANRSAAKPEPIISRDQQLDEGYQLDGSKSADVLAEWILDRATQAQVEALFTALGARWGEARR